MNGNKFNSSSFFVVVATSVIVLSQCTGSMTSPLIVLSPSEPSASSLSSLVGDTMSSMNEVPFSWAPDYELAVVYITTMWSEFNHQSGQLPLNQAAIAEAGYLDYCVRFKTKLAAWAKSLQDRPDVSKTVKKAVSSWYQAIDTLSRDNWQLPKVLSLESFAKQLRTSYKHLVINGGEIYEKADTDKTKIEVDDFTREIANLLIEELKVVWKQLRGISK